MDTWVWLPSLLILATQNAAEENQMTEITPEKLFDTIEKSNKDEDLPNSLLHFFALDCAKHCGQLYRNRRTFL